MARRGGRIYGLCRYLGIQPGCRSSLRTRTTMAGRARISGSPVMTGAFSRIAQESATAMLPALIGLDFGPVLGFELREGIPRGILQAAIEGVDGVLGLQRCQAHGTIAHDVDGKLSARRPPELLAHGLGNDDLPLAGHTGCGLHGRHLTKGVRSVSMAEARGDRRAGEGLLPVNLAVRAEFERRRGLLVELLDRLDAEHGPVDESLVEKYLGLLG